MRISTLSFYDQGVANMESAQSAMAQTQEEISTGSMVNVPSDNPTAATQILEINQAQSTNTQYASNQTTAKTVLAQSDSTLSQVTNVLQNVRTTLITANNGTLSASDRSALASELQGQLSQLVGLANTQDGDGNYIFAGFEAANAPFVQTSSGVTYQGDSGTRAIQISSSRQLPVTVSGDQVFQRVPTGNGVFTTSGALTNSGSAQIDTGSVAAPGDLTGHDYTISFQGSGAQTTYTVTDETTGQPVAAPATGANVYTSGAAIEFDGMQMTISGTPADGDTFSVAPSTNQSIFTTIQNAITMLQTDNGTGSQSGALGGIATSIQNVSQAMTTVATAQSSVGAHEQELSAMTTVNASTNTQEATQLSALQDTDLAKAASLLSEQQTVLSAAEESFAKIANDSLFNYLQA